MPNYIENCLLNGVILSASKPENANYQLRAICFHLADQHVQFSTQVTNLEKYTKPRDREEQITTWCPVPCLQQS